jgi:hypothetical protein
MKRIKIKKKFKEIISIKSQLHQPPQPNSCSAHQEPKNIENNKIIMVFSTGFLFVLKILIKKIKLNFCFVF